MSTEPQDHHRPLCNLPAETDVAVVGGGVVGLCTAYELSRRGREVVVIDKGPIARGSASGNAGFITPSHIIPMAAPGVLTGVIKGMLRRTGPVVVRPSLNPDYLRWIVRFMRFCNKKAAHSGSLIMAALGFRSAELIARWIAEERIDCGYRPDGLLNVYGTPASLDAGKREAAEMQRYGVGIEAFGAREIRELEPALNENVLGGFLCTDDAGLDPGRFLSSLAEVLEARKVMLIPHTELLAVHGSSGAVRRMVTSGGNLAARQVVVAAGAWAPGVASLFGESVSIQPGKGHSMTVAKPSTGPRRNILIGDRWVAVNPMGDRLRMSGWLELGRLDTRPSIHRLSLVESGVRSRIRLDTDLTVLERWAGVRPITPDGLPIIGNSRRWDNVAYAVGHGKLGLSLGPVTGRLVTQLLCGLPTDLDLEPFSPDRFG